MIRHAVAIAVTLCLWPAWLCAQSTEFTVNVVSANVHKGPSTGSPVIGKAPRGTVLEVTRHLGDWVKVTWMEAPDSVGYLHLSAGSMAPRGTSAPAPKAGAPAARPGAGPSRATLSSPRPADAPLPRGTLFDPEPAMHEHAAPAPALYINPPTHKVGLGGQVSGSTLGWGASARVWTQRRFGVQFDLSRYALTNPALPGRVTTVRVAPSALYAFTDRVTDYFWLRPYVGGGFNLHRQTFSEPAAGIPSISEQKMGYQAFGGSEVTFPTIPRFALSADVGYRWGAAAFEGFELGGLGFSIAGHWYFK